jgi:hypothetical protein
MAVFWHEGPPEGHSSPGTHMASLSPQFTEHPPQLPRGDEAGTLHELPPEGRSDAGEPEAVELGGPVSLADPLG